MLGPFLAALLLSVPASPYSRRSDVSTRIQGLAADLVRGYEGRQPSAEKASLAVMPFNSSESLERRRVGFALSELLGTHVVRDGRFTVLERGALDEVMREQRFQAGGAVDEKTAIRIGRLIGARLLLLGSVARVGRHMQVNARIVSVESGEVLSASFAELDAEDFLEEARPFLAPVPEVQAIGLYFLYNYRHNPNSLAPEGAVSQNPNFPPAGVITPQSFDMHMFGIGVRYSPLARLMLDLSAAFLSSGRMLAASTVPPEERSLVNSETYLVQGTVNWTPKLVSGVRGIAGLGLASYTITPGEATYGTVIVPRVRAGVEWRVQSRVGLGFLTNYDFLTRTGKDKHPHHGAIIKVSGFSVEPTLTLYF